MPDSFSGPPSESCRAGRIENNYFLYRLVGTCLPLGVFLMALPAPASELGVLLEISRAPVYKGDRVWVEGLPGAAIGGLILGIAEALAGGIISVAFKNTLACLIIIIVLLFRPKGLLGKEFVERV